MKSVIRQNAWPFFLRIVLYILFADAVFAQQPNYSEVHVYGWGLALDRGAPVFYDIDDDGYMDMLTGNENGTIWHYEQTKGNEFVLISKQFNDIDVGSQSSPVIDDIDRDGLLDLVIGANDKLHRFEQDSTGSYHFSKIEGELVEVDIGAAWAPAFADLNGDSLLDLIVGESLSNLNYFVQDSFAAPTFHLVNENWLDWSWKNYQSPVFTDLENDGLLDLLIGGSSKNIVHLIQDSANALTFHKVNDQFGDVNSGQMLKPQILDIDGDDKLDLYVGNYYYGLTHYEQESPGSANYLPLNDNVLGMRDFGSKIGYTIEDLDHDGLLDMLISAFNGTSDAHIVHLEQEQKGSLNFILVTDAFNDLTIDHHQSLCLYDINGNGLYDLFIGDVFGYISRYEQDAVDSYGFTLQEEYFNQNMKVNQISQPAFTDLDGDSLLDMIVGEGGTYWKSYLHHYEQDSVNALTFTELNNSFLDINFRVSQSPVFTDIDGDSLLDLILGDQYGKLSYFEQDSVHSVNFVQISDDFSGIRVISYATPRFADVNNDGKTDLLIGDDAGGITLYLRNDEMDLTPPDVPQNLSAQVEGDYVRLMWTPCAATDLMLYNIYRGLLNDTSAAEYIYSVNADKTEFTDTTLVTGGTYFYWISSMDMVGNESALSLSDSIYIELTGISDANKTPRVFRLFQNYPNPFNPVTHIKYSLPKPGKLRISIYNSLGQKVATLLDAKKNAGIYDIYWDASHFASGMYFVRMESGVFVEIIKCLLIK